MIAEAGIVCCEIDRFAWRAEKYTPRDRSDFRCGPVSAKLSYVCLVTRKIYPSELSRYEEDQVTAERGKVALRTLAALSFLFIFFSFFQMDYVLWSISHSLHLTKIFRGEPSFI